MLFENRNPFVFFFVCLLIVLMLVGIKTYFEKTQYPFENVNKDFMKDERTPVDSAKPAF